MVTEFYDDWPGIHEQYRESIPFPLVPASALRATLGILARTVAPGKPRPILDSDARSSEPARRTPANGRGSAEP